MSNKMDYKKLYEQMLEINNKIHKKYKKHKDAFLLLSKLYEQLKKDNQELVKKYSELDFSTANVWILRVKDGINFKNSIQHRIWGLQKRYKNWVKKFKQGDLLCFATSKQTGGGYIIGIAEFVEAYNRADEPLLQINTMTNEELGWVTTDTQEEWDIQIKYKNLVNTSGKDIMKTLVRHPSSVLNYDEKLTCEKHLLPKGIRTHYKNFLKYGMKY